MCLSDEISALKLCKYMNSNGFFKVFENPFLFAKKYDKLQLCNEKIIPASFSLVLVLNIRH